MKRLIDSFNYAVQGIIYTLKTQRNMRIHFFVMTLILILSLFFNFSKLELLSLFFAISLVIIAEMINTAVEKTIDMFTSEFHPLAKIAKNVAAGAVLVAALNSIMVGYLLFFDRVNPFTKSIIFKIRSSPVHLTFICILLITIITVVIKTVTQTGTPFKGGIISGHAALAFTISTVVTFLTENILIATLSFMLSILVGQSRIEGEIHTFFQVVNGALLGILITVLIFQLL
ncbi:diacylglycerol kinase [Senegalia massiliensis]|uniref:Diacylglycerol kinase n=1 Tax=Senegalia massiliensis TaxID=1720316 RepID=A0A845R0P6_9CLOT|nr:diacylglycerol kinase [Senegalia massiliensis]NBI07012.1 diacylglycerol kinase [Senegalia massiliensis]